MLLRFNSGWKLGMDMPIIRPSLHSHLFKSTDWQATVVTNSGQEMLPHN